MTLTKLHLSSIFVRIVKLSFVICWVSKVANWEVNFMITRTLSDIRHV